jgi:hypothetical protein
MSKIIKSKRKFWYIPHPFVVGFKNQTMTHNELDALGNKLVIGQRYGYSQSNNGITRVVVGDYVKQNKSSVTLSIVYSHGGYDYKQEDYNSFTRKVSVRSIILFPCFDYKTKDEIDAEVQRELDEQLRLRGSQYEFFGQAP